MGNGDGALGADEWAAWVDGINDQACAPHEIHDVHDELSTIVADLRRASRLAATPPLAQPPPPMDFSPSAVEARRLKRVMTEARNSPLRPTPRNFSTERLQWLSTHRETHAAVWSNTATPATSPPPESPSVHSEGDAAEEEEEEVVPTHAPAPLPTPRRSLQWQRAAKQRESPPPLSGLIERANALLLSLTGASMPRRVIAETLPLPLPQHGARDPTRTASVQTAEAQAPAAEGATPKSPGLGAVVTSLPGSDSQKIPPPPGPRPSSRRIPPPPGPRPGGPASRSTSPTGAVRALTGTSAGAPPSTAVITLARPAADGTGSAAALQRNVMVSNTDALEGLLRGALPLRARHVDFLLGESQPLPAERSSRARGADFGAPRAVAASSSSSSSSPMCSGSSEAAVALHAINSALCWDSRGGHVAAGPDSPPLLVRSVERAARASRPALKAQRRTQAQQRLRADVAMGGAEEVVPLAAAVDRATLAAFSSSAAAFAAAGLAFAAAAYTTYDTY